MAIKKANTQTKAGIVEYLEKNLGSISDESLAKQVGHVLKNVAKVKLEDLKAVSTEVASFLIMGESLAPVENKVKITPKKQVAPQEVEKKAVKPVVAKKAEVVSKVDLTTAEAIDEVANKAEEKKPVVKAKAKVEPKAQDTKTPAKKESKAKENAIDMLGNFPREIDSQLGKLVFTDKYTTFEEFRKATEEEGKELVFAVYWSKRILRQFNYDAVGMLKNGSPKSFENDLDLVTPMYNGSVNNTVFGLSAYTEYMYIFVDGELAIEDDLRFVNGAEYALYEVVAE